MVASKNCIEKSFRARLLWPIAGMAVVLLVTAALVQSRNSRTTPVAAPATVIAKSAPAITTSPAPRAANRAAVAARPSPDVGNLPQVGANLREPEVQARAAELMQLAMNNDAASLDTILKELRNPNRDIRAAALQAAIQFGSRDAIPSLTEAAQNADDPSERTQLVEAIEFLKLPSLSEVMLKGRALQVSAPPSSH